MAPISGHGLTRFTLVGALFLLSSCSNNPYRPGETVRPTYFGSFDTPPSRLDPATAYYSHEGRIIDQIYEPPLTYHYLKRPYEVIPLTAEAVPQPAYFDTKGRALDDPDPPSDAVGRVEYTVRLRAGIRYQRHPCFARDPEGRPCYRDATRAEIARFEYPSDFKHQDSRELRAADYALQVRRLADPRLTCPIFSTLEQYMTGMAELQAAFTGMIESERARRKAAAGAGYNQEQDEQDNPIHLDYMKPDLPGFQVLDDRTFKIVLKRKYPQMLYWLCMHFFAPMPQEALDFYAIPVMAERQFSVNRCPVGTGPYYLKTYRPNELMVLEHNPYYHADFYPSSGNPGDAEAGFLRDAGQRLPFIQTQHLRMEKEFITDWHKFLQGYLDASGIASDVFDQAINISKLEGPRLSDSMQKQGIRLVTDVDTTLFYTSFNMLDDVVGGYGEKRQKLRQAISIALDYNEFLDIFRNGRGVAAQGPIPPGIFGFRPGKDGTNPFVSEWDPVTSRHVRKPIETARKLMEEAGYPGGMLPDGQPLTLNYDHSQGGDTAFRAYFDWTRNRLSLLGIRLLERGTDLTRYREKRKQGNWQIGSGGWLADYPDPENFLFLFFGPNREAEKDGPNMANYNNPEYDALFRRMESMGNTPERQAIIDQMVRIIQRDAPAVWQFHPVSFILTHQWFHNYRPHQMSYNTMKFARVDGPRRAALQKEWNRPVLLPVVVLVAILLLTAIPAAVSLHRREGALVAMGAYILRRILYAIPILLGVNILLFSLFFFVNSPDVMARRMLGEKRATQSQIDNWKRQRGYHLPMAYNRAERGFSTFTQTIFWQKTMRLFIFDFGRADQDNSDIGAELRRRIPYSLSLTVPIFLGGLALYIFFAMVVAFYRGTYVDTWALVLCVLMMSISTMFYILGGQYLLAIKLRLVPLSGSVPLTGPDGNIPAALNFLLLPILIGIVSEIGGGVRYYRTIFLEEINKDYVRTARAKGLGEGTVLFKHALKNAMIPILTNVVVTIPFLITGSLLFENFFGIHGLGSFTIDAYHAQDFACVRSMVFLGSVLYVGALVCVDISYTLVDPRVRLK